MFVLHQPRRGISLAAVREADLDRAIAARAAGYCKRRIKSIRAGNPHVGKRAPTHVNQFCTLFNSYRHTD